MPNAAPTPAPLDDAARLDLFIERAMDLALGAYGHASAALADVTDELGRPLTPAEHAEWLECTAEAARQVSQ